MPVEYLEYLMGVKFGKLPHEIREMPEEDFERCLLFMQAEAEADRMKTFQSQHYAK